MSNVIEVKNLNFGYDRKLVLENVNFTIEKGDYVGIIGANGSAKSTLVKLLLKLIPPASGEIKILGENIEKFNAWERIGYISQKANAFNASFPATVEEVVGANLFSKVGLFKPLKKIHKDMIEHTLEIVGMQDFRHRLIGGLSGGQLQRVLIARVLVNKPEIMFLDEPTVGIDAKSEEVVYCLLGKLNVQMGITVAMVTHDISAITVHANKLACMVDKGVVIHNMNDGMAIEDISNLYGYGVNLHIVKHNCESCAL